VGGLITGAHAIFDAIDFVPLSAPSSGGRNNCFAPDWEP
jgi:hypothetical protein